MNGSIKYWTQIFSDITLRMLNLAILDFLHGIVLVLKTDFYQVDVFLKHYI